MCSDLDWDNIGSGRGNALFWLAQASAKSSQGNAFWLAYELVGLFAPTNLEHTSLSGQRTRFSFVRLPAP